MPGQSLGTLTVRLDALTAQFDKKMADAEKTIRDATAGAKELAVASGAAFAAGSIAIGKFVADASDANEQLNVIEQSFGKDQVAAVEDWAKAVSKEVGRSTIQIKDFAGQMQSLLSPMTGNKQAAAEMSTELTKLAVDLGSFFNKADTDVLMALKSGLVGSTEPMRAMGVELSVAAMKQFALNKGIEKSVETMTQAEKVALRYRMIIAQTTSAQGDAARTGAGLANMTKRIQGQMKDLSVSIGQSLLPAAEKTAQIVSRILDYFQELSPQTKALAAKMLAAGTALAGITAALSGIALALPSVVAGFKLMGKAMLRAVIPALPVVAAIAAGIAGLILIVGAAKQLWDEFGADIKKVAGDLKMAFDDAFDAVFKKAKEVFGWIEEKAILIASWLSGASPEQAMATVQEAQKGGGLLGGDAGKENMDAVADAIAGAGGFARQAFGDLTKTFKAGIGVFGDLLKPVTDITDELNKPETKGALGAGSLGAGAGAIGKDMGPAIDRIMAENIARIDFEQGLSEAQAAAAEGSGKLGAAGRQITETVTSSLGEVGSVVQSGMQGFATAGPFGMIGAILADLLTRTQSFGRIVGMLNRSLQWVTQIIDPLIGMIEPLVESIIIFSHLISKISMQLFRATGLMKGLQVVFEKVAEIIDFFVESITKVWNWIVNKLAGFVDAIPKMGWLADKIKGALIDFSDIAIPVEELEEEIEEPANNAGRALNRLADSTNKANSSMTNVPSGLKVAFTRFQSIMADTMAPAMPTGGGFAGGSGPGVNINNLTILAENPTQMREALEQEARWNNYVDKGTTISTAPRYGLTMRER